MNGNPLGVANAARLWQREISNAPAYMLPRELTQNAIDSIGDMPNGRINWMGIDFGGAKKLAIQDNGCGMDEAALINLTTQMSWSGAGKDLAMDGNFGCGARLIGLRASPAGLVYFSKFSGDPVVRSAHLAVDEDGVPICASEPKPAVDCPVDLGDHGTLVVVLGASDSFDSFKEPWPGCPKNKSAVIRTLTERYFRLPSNVSIYFDSNFAKYFASYPNTAFKSISDNFNACDQYECVETEGLRVHFAYYSKPMHHHRTQEVSLGTFGGVAWRGEIINSHNQKSRPSWELESQHFGLDRIHKNLTLIVELESKPHEYLPSTDRTCLIWRNPQDHRSGYSEKNREVKLRNFKKEIQETIPQWLKEKIAVAKNKDLDDALNHSKQIQIDFYRKLGLLKEVAQKSDDGDLIGDEDHEAFNGEHGDSDHKRTSKNAKPRIPNGEKTPAIPSIGIDSLPEVLLVDFDPRIPMTVTKKLNGVFEIRLNTSHEVMRKFKDEITEEFSRYFESGFDSAWEIAANTSARECFTPHFAVISLLEKSIKEFSSYDATEGAFGALAFGHVFSFMYEVRRKMNEQKRRLIRAA